MKSYRQEIYSKKLNSLGNLDRQVEHNSKNLSSLGDQVKQVEQDRDNGFSSRSFLSGKFCCQFDSRTSPVIDILLVQLRILRCAQNDRVKP